MSLSRVSFDDDACPVGDDLLGNLYRTSEHGLAQLVESVSGDVRAMLALFCYRRAHLHSMSLAIAATCSEQDLREQGGVVGTTLYALSREAPHPERETQSGRRSITLSTKPLRTLPPLADDEIDPISA